MNLYSHFEIAFIYAKHITLDIKLLFTSHQTKKQSLNQDCFLLNIHPLSQWII
ncbi:hypothetical protein HMPREF0772_10664 [Staphylococcus aureus subsp. aureus TCH60]|uniref:Uncharacterized protein n=1 Tax=Staphylococcus aureus subsp. aureus MN8 TaxID=548470 RepID=A0A0E1XBA6_STAAU|nr:hypothetical protein HMPREF0772_10664 [Staphylococcus aureus subsp. aureus TCH60]EFH96622.1 hypothetical protein HMPREF0769_10624 [Staphylococcus aureus subsp. aureus MN8]